VLRLLKEHLLGNQEQPQEKGLQLVEAPMISLKRKKNKKLL
jgi:hypothetical protein